MLIQKQKKYRLPRKIKKQIPKGMYCYTSLGEIWNKDGKYEGIRIKRCPMYFENKLGFGDCKYCFKIDGKLNGEDGNIDFCLDDQCKSCSFKWSWN